MRWFLVLLATSGCRSQSTSPSPAPPSPARAAIAAAPLPALAPEPVLVEELPWVDPEEPKVGAIAGVILDSTGESVAGVTIVASPSEGTTSQVAITEDDGSYLIEDVAPDDYVVTMYYTDQTFEHRVHVEDELVEVTQTIDPNVGSIYIGCGGVQLENTYIVDGIDTTGLTFGE